MRQNLLGTLALVLSIGSNASIARAGDSAAAEALFQEGKTLLGKSDYAHACPKLDESYRLDPATGTLLALAMCHEGEGKNATAWAQYTEVAVRSKREGRDDRERAAREKAQALQAKLSYLTLEVSPESKTIPGLEIKRDGVAVGAGAWGSAVPVDPGEHRVEASAPGKQPWSQQVAVTGEGTRQTVTIPLLANQTTAPGEKTATPAEQGKPQSGLTGMQVAGLVVGGVGVVGLGIGSFFGLRAMSQKSESDANCPADNVCTDAASYDTRKDAVSSGTLSTIGFVAGGVLAVGGVSLYLLGRPHKQEQQMGRLVATVTPLAGGGGVWMSGRF